MNDAVFNQITRKVQDRGLTSLRIDVELRANLRAQLLDRLGCFKQFPNPRSDGIHPIVAPRLYAHHHQFFRPNGSMKNIGVTV